MFGKLLVREVAFDRLCRRCGDERPAAFCSGGSQSPAAVRLCSGRQKPTSGRVVRGRRDARWSERAVGRLLKALAEISATVF